MLYVELFIIIYEYVIKCISLDYCNSYQRSYASQSNTSEFATPTRKSNAKSPKSPYLEQVSEGGSMQESNVYDDSPHSGHWTAGSPSGKYTPPRSLKSPKSPYLPQVRERDYPGVEST